MSRRMPREAVGYLPSRMSSRPAVQHGAQRSPLPAMKCPYQPLCARTLTIHTHSSFERSGLLEGMLGHNSVLQATLTSFAIFASSTASSSPSVPLVVASLLVLVRSSTSELFCFLSRSSAFSSVRAAPCSRVSLSREAIPDRHGIGSNNTWSGLRLLLTADGCATRVKSFGLLVLHTCKIPGNVMSGSRRTCTKRNYVSYYEKIIHPHGNDTLRGMNDDGCKRALRLHVHTGSLCVHCDLDPCIMTPMVYCRSY